MADMLAIINTVPPHPFYDFIKPLYWPHHILKKNENEIIDACRKKIEEFIDMTLLMAVITNCALDNFPSTIFTIRPPQFNYAYQNRTNKKLFIKMSMFYRTILPNILNYVSPSIVRIPEARKIRVGFISNMISKLSSVFKDRGGIMQRLDRSRFDVVLFMFDEPNGDMMKACLSTCKTVVLPRTLDARPIVESFKFDVIVYCDLNMCGEVFILSHNRLAPCQINTFGHSETSGINTIDVFVSSKLYEVESAQEHFSERLIVHNSLSMYYYRPVDSTIISTFGPRSKFHLPKKPTLFLCFQSPFKIMPCFHPVLKAIVNADPNNVLVFTPGFLGAVEDIEFFETLECATEYKNQLIVFRERIDYLSIHNLIAVCDVILDTFPFTGCNTSLESFNVGKPVVTMPSAYLNGRFTAGFYEFMSRKGKPGTREILSHLVCYSVDEYIAECIRLGKDIEHRKECSDAILDASKFLWEDTESLIEWDKMLTDLTSEYIKKE